MKSILVLSALLNCVIISFSQFGSPQLVTSHAHSRAITTGDLDGDGDEDIVYTSYTSTFDKLVWHENINGVFSSQRLISSDCYTGHALEVVDLDQDGDLDIISDQHNVGGVINLVWYENNGDAAFVQHYVDGVEGLGDVVSSADAGDFDGDGDFDILISTSDWPYVKWLRNNGNAISWTMFHMSPTNAVSNARMEDVDGDGDIDILEIGSFSGGSIKWFENEGAGIFNEQLITSDVESPNQIYFIDLNDDGLKDILASSEQADDKIFWCRNLGAGTFATMQIITTAVDQCDGIYPFDMDGDGDLDVVSASSADNKIAWYANSGTGFFGPQQIISTQYTLPSLVCAADFDGDGFGDVAAVYEVYSPSSKCDVAYFMNSGIGTFTPPILLSGANREPTSVFCADLNNDGKEDILASFDASGTIGWFENLGDHQFTPLQYISTVTVGVNSVYAADLDGDSDLDVLSASTTDDKFATYENLGGGIFGPQVVLPGVTDAPSKIRTIDYDHDGDEDIMACLSAKIVRYDNPGTGVFGTYTNFLNPASDSDKMLEFADIDLDGWEDAVYTSSNPVQGIYWRHNDSGYFEPQQLIFNTTSFSVPDIALGDVDQDGFVDVIAAVGGDLFLIKKLPGTGFAPSVTISDNSINAIEGCAFMDADEDGDLDIYISMTDDNQIVWHENLGAGNFGAEQLISSGIQDPRKITFADLNSDGDNELIFTAWSISPSYEPNHVGWLENNTYDAYQARGKVFIDFNENGIFEPGDTGIHLMKVLTNPLNDYSFTFSNGDYFVNFDEDLFGTYELFPELHPYWHITSDSLLYHLVVDNSFTFVDSLDFGIFADTIANSVVANLTGDFASCNQNLNYWLSVGNIGTTIPSGIIHLKLDPQLTFLSAEIVPDSIVGQNIYWNFDSLYYFNSQTFAAQVQAPDFTSMGDTLLSHLVVYIDSIAPSVYADSVLFDQIMVCAYDPNDKIAYPAGVLVQGYIPDTTEYLEYTIRFQNTGTDTAHTVVIEDQLDINLQWNSLVPLAWSHDMEIDVDYDGVATFTFENIMLADSNINEPASHGFVKFRINLKPNLSSGTIIQNTAEIYFDQNPAVITNTKVNTIFDCGSLHDGLMVDTEVCDGTNLHAEINNVLPASYVWVLDGINTQTGADYDWLASTAGNLSLTLSASTVFCESSDTVITIIVNEIPVVQIDEFSNDTICIYSGLIPVSAIPAGGTFTGPGIAATQFNPSIAGQGQHTIAYTFSDLNGCVGSDILEIFVDGCLGNNGWMIDGVSIYPNPTSDEITIYVNENPGSIIHVSVMDVMGKTVISTDFAGASQKLSLGHLSSGTYVVIISTDSIRYLQKIVLH